MNREKPEYLNHPAEPKGSNWVLIVIGLAVATLFVLGVLLYGRTVSAWEAKRAPAIELANPIESGLDPKITEAYQEGFFEGEAKARAMYEREIQQWQRGELKCVGNTVFRKNASGGWDNLPYRKC